MARWQSGHAADCKSPEVGSIPARASKIGLAILPFKPESPGHPPWRHTKEIALIQVTLFHDGCNLCLSIDRNIAAVFTTPQHRYESFDLALQPEHAAKARALGITRLPSLVIDGRVLRLEDHSPIEHYA